MSLAMNEHERQEPLAGVHIGVIAIERADGPPLTVPIWYGYEPGGLVWIITGAESLKGRLLNAARRFSLCAQTEEPPFYKYVSVEGPIVDVAPAELRSRPTLAGAPLLRPGARRRLRGQHRRRRRPQVLDAPDSLVVRRLHALLSATRQPAIMVSGFGGRYHSSVVDDADPIGEHRQRVIVPEG